MAPKTIDDLDLTPPDDLADLATWLARNFAILLDVHLTSEVVESIFGRTGVVTAEQADYDDFFLTPDEGNAAYLGIGAKAADSELLDGIEGATLRDGSTSQAYACSNLAFPATQVPSADPNTLDHYEEGFWDCILRFGGNSVDITYVGNRGKWVKIGNVAVVSVWLRLSNKGSSVGNATFSGLPFVQAASSEFRGGAAVGYVYLINSGVVRILGNQNNDVISFVDFGSSPLPETVFADSSTIMFTYTYLVD